MFYKINHVSGLNSTFSWSNALAREIAKHIKLRDTHKRATSFLYRVSKIHRANHREVIGL